MDSLLVYGSYGYTGRLVAREAVARGGSPVVAGRDGRQVRRQADELGVEARTFDLAGDVAARIDSFDAVLNCAGPFAETADPLLEACLATGTDYLDITGEFPVFERLRQHDADAREAGITVLPGVGFDVVPSDCLAAVLHDQVPAADELTLAISGSVSVSRGTARTILDLLGNGVVRRNGRLVEVPAAFRTREIDFGDGPEPAVTAPWGDVVTAAHSTGVESIAVYVAVPPAARRALGLATALGWLVDRRPIERALEWAIDAAVDGPSERDLATDTAVVWGEVRDTETGRTARGRLGTPNPYALTAESAVSAAERVLDGEGRVPKGFQTPATALGTDFALDLAGTDLELLDVPTDSSEGLRSAPESRD
ncbi:saccharopine dehydrogenase family protein [Halosolutus amylolyticus]|uniref:Saccharopine dehydrogenase family protein n=1 Tax=Halosolutus amylolyticus TaxID=2932267 RepID=A0ABD5PV39_9EURY|nr:saccharopine dehydrogenase NADP-binding domain-containing protein [Halosolutus amylolyticus]